MGTLWFLDTEYRAFRCWYKFFSVTKIKGGSSLFPKQIWTTVLCLCYFHFSLLWQMLIWGTYWSKFLNHTFRLCVCVSWNKTPCECYSNSTDLLRKVRKQICKNTQWNVRGLAGRLTIKNKLHHIMAGKVN